ncbi:MAG: SusC/RagA family TonB-linked outer membrane protein [Bacteroidota bacterium]
MRRSGFLLLLFCLLMAKQGLSQGVTLSLKNVTLEKVFDEIKKQTAYSFVYSKTVLAKAKPVDVNVTNASIDRVLSICFKDQSLTYSITDKYITIRAKEEETVAANSNNVSEIRGTVTNEEGVPLSGASVKIKGVAKGTAVNEKGNFVLSPADKNGTLVISFVGYDAVEIPVQNRATVNAQLKPSLQILDETIVIAYGTSSKRKNTGTVGSITSAEIGKQPVGNVLAALPGRIAGTLVAQNNGVPGSAIQIQIRGQGSLGQGTIPLYVIDGVPFTNFNGGSPATDNLNAFGTSGASGGISPFNSINPSDIERIDILKDADATSIYGSRGSNGVVLITTKRGKQGKTKLDVGVNTGLSELNRFIPVLNLPQYLELRREAFKNDGVLPTVATAPDLLVWDTTKATDWQKTFLGGTGHLTDVQATLSGGDARTRFLFNSSYRKETTVFPGDFGDRRFATRLNVEHNSADHKFNAAFGVSYSNANSNLTQSDISSIYNLPPNLPLYQPDGKLFWATGFTNPYSTLLRKYSGVTTNLIGNATLRYTILPGLNVKTNFGYTENNLDQKTATPASALNPSTNPVSSAVFSANKAKNWIIEPTAEYITHISEGKLSVLAGASWQHNTSLGLFQTGSNYSSEALLGTLLAAGTVVVNYNNNVQYKYDAVFGRINYDWKSKYILNATFRRDGSSRFGPSNRFGNFGAVGASWVFSEENFMKVHLPFLSFGKLRGSYGTTGNDQISNYIYLPLYNSTTAYLGNPAIYPVTLPNADIHWETTKKLEFALELGFAKDRILFSTNYYRNRSSDQITFLRLPTQSGYNSVTANLPALIQNSGLEMELNTTNIKGKDFKWTTAFNITLPKNKLVDFPGLASTFSATSYVIGQPINFSRAYHYLGVDPATGKALYDDIDKDGAVTFANDRIIMPIGTPYYGGISNTFTYKNLQLDVFFQFNHRYGVTNVVSTRPGALTNQNTSFLNRWKQAGDVTSIPGASATAGTVIANSWSNYTSSDAVWGDASYLKFRSVSLSYNLPTNWIRKVKMSSCRLFAQGQNLFTWSKNKYIFDTETTVQGGPSGLGTGTIGQVLPPLRTIVFGLNCSF